MKFTKMHGIGNDYVYVNCFEETVENPGEVAKFVSDRHFGIGSDGLILIRPSDKADFEMAMYNADGSRGEMCGNGIRCVAKYVYDYKLTDKETISIETLGGIKHVELTVEGGKATMARVNMGRPQLEACKIPVACGAAPDKAMHIVNYPISVGGTQYHMTCVSMGNPHCVVFMDGIDSLDIESIGPKFEHHSYFPNRVNTEFVKVLDKNTAAMRVWERGSGETLACGTGACAAAVACILNGYTDNKVTVELLGGSLEIEWDRTGGEKGGSLYMKGPATTVYEGEIAL